MAEIIERALAPDAAAQPHGGGGPADGDAGSAAGRTAPLSASAWTEAESRVSELIRRSTGHGLADHLVNALNGRTRAQILAVGAAAGGVVLEVMRHAPDAALVCIDSKPESLDAGRQRARELAIDAQFAALDLDGLALEPRAFDLVFCHAVLHRVIRLEAIADQIKRALRPGGTLLAVEVVTRNGYAMWPETREVVQAIWKTLPVKFRLNHTAYTAPLIDDSIWEPGPVPSGELIARPEDIVPALEQRFLTEEFVPHFTMSRRFFDSMYGPNYDLSLPLDRALFEWIWELDLHYLATGRLLPETFFGIYRAL